MSEPSSARCIYRLRVDSPSQLLLIRQANRRSSLPASPEENTCNAATPQPPHLPPLPPFYFLLTSPSFSSPLSSSLLLLLVLLFITNHIILDPTLSSLFLLTISRFSCCSLISNYFPNCDHEIRLTSLRPDTNDFILTPVCIANHSESNTAEIFGFTIKHSLHN